MARLEREMGKVRQPAQQSARAQALQTLQNEMSDELFLSAFDAGRQETLDTALRAVLPDGDMA